MPQRRFRREAAAARGACMTESPKSCWPAVLLGLAGVGLLGLLMSFGGAGVPGSVQRLTEASLAQGRTVLAAAGHDWADVRMVGGDYQLIGAAPAPEDRAAAMQSLRAALGEQRGVPGVFARFVDASDTVPRPATDRAAPAAPPAVAVTVPSAVQPPSAPPANALDRAGCGAIAPA